MSASTILPQQLYRALHLGNEGDSTFYERVVENAGAILEVGAGWGRLSQTLAPKTRCYWGVEIEPSFATEAQETLKLEKSRVDAKQSVDWQIIVGDARTISLPPNRFTHALLPYNIVYALGGIDGFRAVVQRVFESLQVDGELFLDVYPIDDYHEAICAGEVEPEDDGEKVGDVSLNGVQYPVFEESELNIESQSLKVSYQAKDNAQMIAEHQIKHDYLLVGQIIDCIEAAGGEIMLIAGDFDGAPLNAESNQIVIGAIKVKPSP